MPADVRDAQRAGDVEPDAGGLRRAQPTEPPQPGRQVLALDELHDEERLAVVGAGLEAGDDVRVAQDGRGQRLAPEAHRDVGVGDDLAAQQLDRHGPVELGVDRAMDRRHAADPDDLGQPIPLADKPALVRRGRRGLASGRSRADDSRGSRNGPSRRARATRSRRLVTRMPRAPRMRPDGVGGAVAVQALGGGDGRGGRSRHRRVGGEANCASRISVSALTCPSAWRISHSARDQIRPLCVDLDPEILRVVQVGVDAAQAVRHGRGVRDGVPVGDARRVGRRRDDIRDRHRPVVAEAFADPAGLRPDAEPGDLRVMDRVAVLVEDDLGVLGIVDAAFAEAQQVVLVP